LNLFFNAVTHFLNPIICNFSKSVIGNFLNICFFLSIISLLKEPISYSWIFIYVLDFLEWDDLTQICDDFKIDYDDDLCKKIKKKITG